MSQDLTERKGTHVVHVRENSDHELDALFKAAMNPSQTGQSGSIPLRMRNLPPSFWKPPEPQRQMQHVKQGSNDSTGYPVPNIAPGNCNTNLQVAHMRAHSSPASLQQTLSTVPQNPGPQPPLHPRQHSCDLTEVGVEPLPPGWEMAKTADGQRYYLNHLTQTTQWVDPRKTSSPSAIAGNPQPGSQQSPNASSQNLGPLPPGWEQAITPEGDVYYINHMERTTSWYDPRILRLQQQQRLQSQNTCQQGQGQGQRQMSPQVNSPPGQGQGQGQGQNRNQANLQYTQLQLEKERLRKRQEEIARQEMLLRLQMQQQQQLKQQQQGETTSQDIAISQANEMTSVTDPFLGQTNTSDHTRQESTDSGVGGMGSGTSYSLPRTPEDFLSNVDEMDTQDGGGHRQGDFNNMDIGNITSDETSNMDSEDLVPSLQEDISNELLNDMENVLNSNKMDNLLTWL